MKYAKPDPAFRHLILKDLIDYNDGLNLILKMPNIDYICGGYETETKEGDPCLHAHFLVYSQFDTRQIKAQNKAIGITNKFRIPHNKETKLTALPADEDIQKVISYILKNGKPYPYNDNQQHYIINNYDAIQSKATDEHVQYIDKKGKPLTATEKLIKHFLVNKVDIFFGIEINRFTATRDRIIDELLSYGRTHYKIVSYHRILEQVQTILNHLPETQTKLAKRYKANCPEYLS